MEARDLQHAVEPQLPHQPVGKEQRIVVVDEIGERMREDHERRVDLLRVRRVERAQFRFEFGERVFQRRRFADRVAHLFLHIDAFRERAQIGSITARASQCRVAARMSSCDSGRVSVIVKPVGRKGGKGRIVAGAPSRAGGLDQLRDERGRDADRRCAVPVSLACRVDAFDHQRERVGERLRLPRAGVFA